MFITVTHVNCSTVLIFFFSVFFTYYWIGVGVFLCIKFGAVWHNFLFFNCSVFICLIFLLINHLKIMHINAVVLETIVRRI